MNEPVTAPWAPAQVEALNAYQKAGWMHPFTCANRTDGNHVERPGEDLGLLMATKDGWVCLDCDYKQYWAHDFMTDPELMPPPPPWLQL